MFYIKAAFSTGKANRGQRGSIHQQRKHIFRPRFSLCHTSSKDVVIPEEKTWGDLFNPRKLSWVLLDLSIFRPDDFQNGMYDVERWKSLGKGALQGSGAWRKWSLVKSLKGCIFPLQGLKQKMWLLVYLHVYLVQSSFQNWRETLDWCLHCAGKELHSHNTMVRNSIIKGL